MAQPYRGCQAVISISIKKECLCVGGYVCPAMQSHSFCPIALNHIPLDRDSQDAVNAVCLNPIGGGLAKCQAF